MKTYTINDLTNTTKSNLLATLRANHSVNDKQVQGAFNKLTLKANHSATITANGETITISKGWIKK